MTPLPVGKDDDSRPRLANHTCNLQSVLPGVLDAAIWYVERLPPLDTQDFRGLGRLPRTIFGSPACTHLALRQVENPGATSVLCHLEQRPAAGLLNVVTMRGNGQDVERGRRP
jgi:hypothetical protein